MDENFSQRVGKLTPVPKSSFSTFEPKELPFEVEYDDELVNKLSDAILSLGNLNGVGKGLQNPYLLITPYLNKEAVLSSKIEGTRTSLSEVFLHEKEPKKEMNEDLLEVLNYITALNYGLKEVSQEGLSEQLIKKMHKILMGGGARGSNKAPGEYKSLPNWIGGSDDPHEARFVPSHPDSVKKLIENLVNYMNEDKKIHPVIKAAIMHYQFETIHPFRDGNGRIGRMLIMLYLCNVNVLHLPLLYLSAYFEKNRKTYEHRLYNVSAKGQLEEWIKFFLDGVKVQSQDALERATKLQEYKEKIKKMLQEKTNSTNALTLFDHLFMNPYINLKDAKAVLKTKYNSTATNAIGLLMKHKILEERTGKSRDRIYQSPIIKEILESNA